MQFSSAFKTRRLRTRKALSRVKNICQSKANYSMSYKDEGKEKICNIHVTNERSVLNYSSLKKIK